MATTPRTRPVNPRPCMALTPTVRAFVKQLRDAGCQIDGSVASGHVKVYDDGVQVYMALQKGHGAPWIVMTSESKRIKRGK